MAGLIAACLALEDGYRPGNPGLEVPADDLDLDGSAICLARKSTAWPDTDNAVRRAGVHAYGLGGVSAHVVLEKAPGPRRDDNGRKPGTQFERLRFPLDAAPAMGIEDNNPVVADFYDYVTMTAQDRDDRVYLTLAPFESVVPGFSWTRVMQEPGANPAHAALMQHAQTTMRSILLECVDWNRVDRVLDFGCGFATDLIEIAEAHAGLSGVGYTISPAQAEAARSRVAAAGLAERIDIHCRDSAAIPFPGRFQLAIGYEVGHHIRDKAGLFANLAAHLEIGGTLALIDCAADTVAPIDQPDVGSHTSTLTDYADLLTAHGFRIRDCVDASREVANFLVDPGLDGMLDRERGRASTGAAAGGTELLERVQRSWDGFGKALAEGLIRYLLIVAERCDAADTKTNNRRWMGRRWMGVS
jgi:polyketide synthase PksL